jgi:hypothetical protein
MRKLDVTAPPSLAQAFVQRGVFDYAVNLQNQCGEGGDGTFNWLLRFDLSKNQLLTGGAPTTTDPFGVGYCFASATQSGFAVAPVGASVTRASDGSWSSNVVNKLYVPFEGIASWVLPLTKVKLTGVTLSPDGNCIGSYNANGVASPSANGTCADQDPSSCERWHTAGALGGFITLSDADAVTLPQLGKSLCILLTGGVSVDPTGTHCAKDSSGKITATGDFCSTTDAPGGCADSYWFAATFAASAVKIGDGAGVSGCYATDGG